MAARCIGSTQNSAMLTASHTRSMIDAVAGIVKMVTHGAAIRPPAPLRGRYSLFPRQVCWALM